VGTTKMDPAGSVESWTFKSGFNSIVTKDYPSNINTEF